MKNVYLLVTEGLTLDALPEIAQAGIRKVFGQFSNPMPGTVPSNGLQLVDAITDDSFNPAAMAAYGIDWEIIFIGRWDGVPETGWDEIIQPFNQIAFMDYLPEPENGEKAFRIPHKNLGWPDIT